METIYVNSSGSDRNVGTSCSPFPSIQAALDDLSGPFN